MCHVFQKPIQVSHRSVIGKTLTIKTPENFAWHFSLYAQKCPGLCL